MNNEQVQTWCRLKQWLTATNLDRGETWGESINQHSRANAWADALTSVQLSTTNPNNPQNTPNPVNNYRDNNPSFFALFSKSVSLQKQYIYVYGGGLAAHALVRAILFVCLCLCACVFLNICSPNKCSPHA